MLAGGRDVRGDDATVVEDDGVGVGPQHARVAYAASQLLQSASRLYYQFVDERGRVRFVERLDDVPGASRVGVGFVKLDVPPPLTPGDAARARETQIARAGATRRVSTGASASAPAVILYSADWCGACRKAKRHLARRGVDHEERDVDDPQVAAELLRKTGRRSIPVIDVGGRVVTGFSPGAYDALIDRA